MGLGDKSMQQSGELAGKKRCLVGSSQGQQQGIFCVPKAPDVSASLFWGAENQSEKSFAYYGENRLPDSGTEFSNHPIQV